MVSIFPTSSWSTTISVRTVQQRLQEEARRNTPKGISEIFGEAVQASETDPRQAWANRILVAARGARTQIHARKRDRIEMREELLVAAELLQTIWIASCSGGVAARSRGSLRPGLAEGALMSSGLRHPVSPVTCTQAASGKGVAP